MDFRAYEHATAEGRFTIARVIMENAWRATLDNPRADEETLVTRRTAEEVLAALLANQLDRRPGAYPVLDTSVLRLPRTLAEWHLTR